MFCDIFFFLHFTKDDIYFYNFLHYIYRCYTSGDIYVLKLLHFILMRFDELNNVLCGFLHCMFLH